MSNELRNKLLKFRGTVSEAELEKMKKMLPGINTSNIMKGSISDKELEFLSNYNTKASFFEDGSDASWFNLGDIFIPNQPQTLISNNDPQAHKYNAEIRRDHFQSGIANVDETGVYVFPITIGDNFVGTGQLFFFLNERINHL